MYFLNMEVITFMLFLLAFGLLLLGRSHHNTVCGASQIYKKNSDFHKPELPSLLQTID